ncbi:MAG: polysialic acid transporter [Betaproteobacteria bacterium RIFCSPLOWO2_12_FULL_65_14]|nr:MAG: polysialic acid transporter [Betaproteobacteria bacterium RIFCSPLOWO2_12_FULL_65_14]
MLRKIAGVSLLLAATAASAQFGNISPWPGSQSGAAPQETPQVPAQVSPQVTPQAAPIFPARPAAQPAPVPSSIPAPAPAEGPVPGAQPFDYSLNLKSEVFGAHLFTGAFTRGAGSVFNPNHVIAIGDQVQVRLYGAFEYDAVLIVDPQGNVFVPRVGPVRVAGIPNSELQSTLEQSLRRTFRSNVHSYATLAAAQPVRVFVTGFVHRPGMYQGTSSDSVLRYLDQAGGIDPDRGSFLEVQLRRGSQTRATFNLYDFLLTGALPSVQLGDGDAVVVAPRKSTYRVTGLAQNAKRFEFAGTSIDLGRLVALARPQPQATHVRIKRNTGVVSNTEYYAISEAVRLELTDGDEVQFTADKRPGTISVRVEGEHQSAQEYVLPYGSRLGDLVKRIEFSERSDPANIQLYRLSVKERQKTLLQASLKSIESSVLTARSGTGEEAQLRKQEADLILNWVARARGVEPLGQVLVAQAPTRADLLLENGDILRVPVKDGLVLVHGEVLFPNAVAYEERYGAGDYIKRAGGYSQNADTSRIIIAHRDGSFEEGQDSSKVRAGDDVLVLPRVDTKSRQFWKDITQIIFQIAVSAKVILGL